MRIVMISPYPPARDGLAEYSSVLAAELRSDGHELYVISSRAAQASPNEVVGAVPRTPFGAADTARAIVALTPDVVHVHYCVAAFTTALPALLRLISLLRRLGIRIVMTFHDVSRDVGALGPAGRLLYRRLAISGHTIVVHTETARRLLVEIMGRRYAQVIVIPYPPPRLPVATVDPQQLASRFGLAHKRVLLAFGFVHVDKGLDDLVRAFRLLRQSGDPQIEDTRLAVAGAVRTRRGIFRAFELRDWVHLWRVRLMIRRFGLQGAVIFAGYVPSGEILPWFQLADAAVLPYKRIEQSGVANLARSVGTQVVAADVGELAAFVGRSDWCCPPGSPAELANALASFLRRDAAVTPPASNAGQLPEILKTLLVVYAGVARDEMIGRAPVSPALEQ